MGHHKLCDLVPCTHRQTHLPHKLGPPSLGCKGWRGGRPLAARVPACVSAWGWGPWHPAVVQALNCIQLFVTSWTAAHQASLSSTISQSLLKLMSIESVMLSNISSSTARFSSCPQSFPASGSFFSNELALRIRGPKYWSFSISPPNEYLGLISFWIDWFDLPAVQETLKSLF